MVEGNVQLEVATPLGLALSTQVESAQAPSVSGEFGVLPKHIPMLVALKSGLLTYITGGKKNFAAVGPGFAEAGPDKLIVLTDAFKRAEDVDVEKSQRELNAANEKLKKVTDELSSPAYEEALREVQWAQACLLAHAAAQAI